jgi:hypothetical protein
MMSCERILHYDYEWLIRKDAYDDDGKFIDLQKPNDPSPVDEKTSFLSQPFIKNYNCTLDTVSELFNVEVVMLLKNHKLKIQLSTCKRCMTPLCLQGLLIWCMLNADASGGSENKSLTR